MNNPNLRNILIVIVTVVVAVVALSFLGTLLTSVVPIAVTAVIAFIIGRMSVNIRLRDVIRSALTAQTAANKETKPAAAPLKAETPAVSTPAPAPAETLPQKEVNPDLLLDTDFEVKTPEQIEAEARLREQEMTKRTAGGGDVNAALEERRKRLLGSKGE